MESADQANEPNLKALPAEESSSSLYPMRVGRRSWLKQSAAAMLGGVALALGVSAVHERGRVTTPSTPGIKADYYEALESINAQLTPLDLAYRTGGRPAIITAIANVANEDELIAVLNWIELRRRSDLYDQLVMYSGDPSLALRSESVLLMARVPAPSLTPYKLAIQARAAFESNVDLQVALQYLVAQIP